MSSTTVNSQYCYRRLTKTIYIQSFRLWDTSGPILNFGRVIGQISELKTSFLPKTKVGVCDLSRIPPQSPRKWVVIRRECRRNMGQLRETAAESTDVPCPEVKIGSPVPSAQHTHKQTTARKKVSSSFHKGAP